MSDKPKCSVCGMTMTRRSYTPSVFACPICDPGVDWDEQFNERLEQRAKSTVREKDGDMPENQRRYGHLPQQH